MNSKMFQINGERVKTWNPLGGECQHRCVYCWVNILKERYPQMRKKYSGMPRLYESELKKVKRFKEGDTVFVADCCDLFASNVRNEDITKIIEATKQSDATFLFLTKNPIEYVFYLHLFEPKKHILGATIESDKNYPQISKAPPQRDRILAMCKLNYPRKMLSIEPILDGYFDVFVELIRNICPEFVYVGMDNYPDKHLPLPEPPLEKTKALIEELKEFTEVRVKTLKRDKP